MNKLQTCQVFMKMHELFLRAVTSPTPPPRLQFLTGNKLYSIPKVSLCFVFQTIWHDLVQLFAMLSVNVRENSARKHYLEGKYKPKSQWLRILCKILDEIWELKHENAWKSSTLRNAAWMREWAKNAWTSPQMRDTWQVWNRGRGNFKILHKIVEKMRVSRLVFVSAPSPIVLCSLRQIQGWFGRTP